MLENYLKKIGVDSFSDLNEEEKATYRDWEISLSGRKLTDGDVEIFLANELDMAVSRLTAVNLTIEDAAFRKAEVKLIKMIQAFLNGPLVEKSYVERTINNLSNK